MNGYKVVLAVSLLVSGCASARRADVTSPAVQPSARLPSVEAAGTQGASAPIRNVPTRPFEARSARSGPGTVEQSSAALSESLAFLSVDPSAENHVRVGDAYRAAGILDQAFAQYSAASKLDPESGAAWDGMARIWRDWGFPNLALADASRAVFFGPGSAAARNTLGTVLLAMGRGPDARAQFQRALALDPAAAYALNNLCYAWFSEGDGVVGAEACRQALALAPDMAPARNNLALVYAALGDLEGTEREFSAAGTPAATAYNLGIVYMAQGRFRDASAAFDRAASLQPGLSQAAARARQARKLADASPGAEER